MSNVARKFMDNVEADLEREFPGITARWRELTAPDAIPGADDLDETPEAAQAWPVSQGDTE